MGNKKDQKNKVAVVEKKKVGRPAKYETAEEMQVAIDKYFIDCDKKEKPYTISGLALGLGFCNRTSFLDYIERSPREFSDTIRRAKARVEMQLDEKLLMSGQNTTGIIFNLKNNFGWVDKHEVKTDLNVNVNLVDLFEKSKSLQNGENIVEGEAEAMEEWE